MRSMIFQTVSKEKTDTTFQSLYTMWSRKFSNLATRVITILQLMFLNFNSTCEHITKFSGLHYIHLFITRNLQIAFHFLFLLFNPIFKISSRGNFSKLEKKWKMKIRENKPPFLAVYHKRTLLHSFLFVMESIIFYVDKFWRWFQLVQDLRKFCCALWLLWRAKFL